MIFNPQIAIPVLGIQHTPPIIGDGGVVIPDTWREVPQPNPYEDGWYYFTISGVQEEGLITGFRYPSFMGNVEIHVWSNNIYVNYDSFFEDFTMSNEVVGSTTYNKYVYTKVDSFGELIPVGNKQFKIRFV
ncbi:MAG: hypothetical protein GX275_01765 [Clostridiales bacterium]|nr:hypothetical protein [Clostridiales bacterium]